MKTGSVSKQGLTWLITGCSSGLGLSLTRTIIAAEGHTVIATSRNPSQTPDLVDEVQKQGGKWLQLDVKEPRASGELIDKLESEGTKIDVLVNNAGYNIFAPIETTTEEEIRGQLETMFFGPLRLIRSVLPYMRQRKSGTIVNFSSGAALMGNESMGVYAGAKAGLDALTRVLKKEVAPFNIRTLTVILGTFNTNFGDGSPKPSIPIPSDYQGTMVDKVMQAISSGTLKPNGDKDKAMRAVYSVVVGESAGEGHEMESLLPLTSDMIKRVEVVQKHLQHGVDVFGYVASSVDADQ